MLVLSHGCCLLEGRQKALHHEFHGSTRQHAAARGSTRAGSAIAHTVAASHAGAAGDAADGTPWARATQAMQATQATQAGPIQFAGAHHARDRGQGPEAWPLTQSIGHDGLPRRPGPRESIVRACPSPSATTPGQARRGTKHATEERTARWTSVQCYGASVLRCFGATCSCATELTTLRYDLSRDALDA